MRLYRPNERNAFAAVLDSLCWPLMLLFAGSLCLPSNAFAGSVLLEASFDDGPDGSGGPDDGDRGINNHEEDSAVVATLTGNARRSTFEEGKYGRAIDLRSGGAVLAEPFLPADGFSFNGWVRLEASSSGNILSWGEVLHVFLLDGELRLSGDASDSVGTASGLMWPNDGAFHHLSISVATDLPNGTVTVRMFVDFAAPSDGATLAADSPGPLTLGNGLAGWLDDVIIYRSPDLSDERRFDRDPTDCGAHGLACIEKVLKVTPGDFPFPIPVRYKVIVDPKQCDSEDSCVPLFDVSGGGSCLDDYSGPEVLREFAQAGFIAVAVDHYCEVRTDRYEEKHNRSQLIHLKNALPTEAGHVVSVKPGPYYASGGSYGGKQVMGWALKEADHPTRTFGRSPGGMAIHCAAHAQKICPNRVAAIPADHVDDVATCALIPEGMHGVLNDVTVETTRDREVAVSWGTDLSPQSPMCNADGTDKCFETGGGFAYGAKVFRERWLRLEDPAAPTGFFFENDVQDCHHTLSPEATPALFACGVCFLNHGRQGMETKCPDCLSVPQGDAVEACSLCEQGQGGGGAGSGSTGGMGGIPDTGGSMKADDVNSPEFSAGGDPHVTEVSSGCGCRIGAPAVASLRSSLTTWALFLVACLGMLRRSTP